MFSIKTFTVLAAIAGMVAAESHKVTVRGLGPAPSGCSLHQENAAARFAFSTLAYDVALLR